jgi:hypothetical protein
MVNDKAKIILCIKPRQRVLPFIIGSYEDSQLNEVIERKTQSPGDLVRMLTLLDYGVTDDPAKKQTAATVMSLVADKKSPSAPLPAPVSSQFSASDFANLAFF